eukprot:TRINITY_DN395_c1_g1_i1.p1 TRINITY_DN395_c1_g1~~TRINITY_DN395_c1_g1_i1.p1  ORF type:complete len:142 (+),score=17.49 TRINITY_DN395_c1_g1_i1:85-510(+)
MTTPQSWTTICYGFSALYTGVAAGLMLAPAALVHFYVPAAPLDSVHLNLTRVLGFQSLAVGSLLCPLATTVDAKTKRIAAQSFTLFAVLHTGYWVYAAVQNKSFGLDRLSTAALAAEIGLGVLTSAVFGYCGFCPVASDRV